MEKKPKTNGARIRAVRSRSSCFQSRRSIAKRTPMPEIKKTMGIRQTLMMDMITHSLGRDCSFWIKKIFVAQGWKLTTTW